ncbi:MAG: hypothetical protein NTW25_01405 [Candidatus Kapabacteria bacterium]|nr:hypothetical protein [Candidatus Kapabacteria bacterium]
MKTSSLFWGVFLISLGIYYTFTNFYAFSFDLSFIVQLWPLLLVFWGFRFLNIPKEIKYLVAFLKGILIALLFIHLFSFNWLTGHFNHFSNMHSINFSTNDSDDDEENCDSTNNNISSNIYDSLKVNFLSKVQFAELNFSGGAGKFYIRDTTNQLIEVKGASTFNENNLSYSFNSDTSKIKIDYNTSDGNNMLRKRKQESSISLNTNPIWDIDIESGAGKFDFDLSNYKVRKVNIETGASNSIYKFGSKLEQINITLSSGMANMVLKIPKESGCYVSTESVLSNRNFTNFKKEGDNFRSLNFDNSKNKIYINMEGALSNYKIVWY